MIGCSIMSSSLANDIAATSEFLLHLAGLERRRCRYAKSLEYADEV
jgi:hypothetical protein